MNKIEMVIFDLDGVLVDACEWHRVALNMALKKMSNYEISLEDHHLIYNGIPTKVKLQKLNDLGIIDKIHFDVIESLKQEYTIELINKTAFIRQEKIDLLNFLKKKNIIVCCYTNSIRKTAELMLEKTGILSIFDLVLTNQDVTFSKPNPQGYEIIMNKYGVQKDRTIIIEDSANGFEAAYRSGARVFKVRNQDDVNIRLFEGFI